MLWKLDSTLSISQQLMSQLTSRIRLYGADCNQTALVVRHSVLLKIT